jgi:chaperonin cofactor prefoldin
MCEQCYIDEQARRITQLEIRLEYLQDALKEITQGDDSDHMWQTATDALAADKRMSEGT